MMKMRKSKSIQRISQIKKKQNLFVEISLILKNKKKYQMFRD